MISEKINSVLYDIIEEMLVDHMSSIQSMFNFQGRLIKYKITICDKK
jgi:hypothetical protein